MADVHNAAVGSNAIYVSPDQIVSLILASMSGLEIGPNGVYIDLSPDSGLDLDATGLHIGTPGTLSASTTNSVDNETHYHDVETASAAYNQNGKILATGATADLSVGTLGVGTAADFLAALKVVARTDNEQTVYIKRRSATQGPPVLNIEDESGERVLSSSGSTREIYDANGNPRFAIDVFGPARFSHRVVAPLGVTMADESSDVSGQRAVRVKTVNGVPRIISRGVS